MNRGKKLTQNTIIIAFGKISTQFVSFILLPFYTTILTTKEYGVFDLINTIVQLSIPIISLMIEQAAFRYLLENKNDKEKSEVITTSLHILAKMAIIFSILMIIITFFYHSKYNLLVSLIIIITSFNNLLLQFARGLDNTKLYSLCSFICSSLIIVFNVILLSLFHMGVIGMLLATLIGNLISAIILAYKLKLNHYYSKSSYDKILKNKLVKYSLPLIPNNISLWLMNSSDKFIVSLFLGVSMNGILAISHKFPAIYMTFFGIFLLAWQEFVAIHYFDKDKDEYLSNMINNIFSIFAWTAILIILAIPIVFNLFINSNYSEAYNNIPIYMIAFLFDVVIGLLGAIYVANKKTIEIVKTTTIAAIINIISNIFLIKYIGLYAAAVSTLIGYFIAMILRIIDTKKYIKLSCNYKKLITLFISLVLACILYYTSNKLYIIVSVPLFMAIIIFSERKVLKEMLSIIVKKGEKNEKH